MHATKTEEQGLKARKSARIGSDGDHFGSDERMVELGRLLTDPGVPEKQDILRVKHLIRELTPDGQAGEERVRSFVSAYFDIYLGRVTGERSLEREGLRRCLAELASSGHAAPRP